MSLTIIILTHNSQSTLKSSLRSALFADQVLIIDDASTDKTHQIINDYQNKHKHIKLYEHLLHNNFSAQRNWALNKASHEWVFFLDADEIIPKPLAIELENAVLTPNNKIQGYYLKRIDFLFDQELKFGETSQIKLLRLARKNAGHWTDEVHEEWKTKNPTGTLKNALIHKRHLTLDEFLNRINWYTSIRANQLYDLKQKESLLKLFLNPIGKFFYNYFYKLGCLDGYTGLTLAWLMSWHSLLVRVKLRLLNLNNGHTYFKPQYHNQ